MRTNNEVAPVSPLRLSLQVFALLAAVYVCTWAGHYTTGDGATKIAWAKAMLFGHTAQDSSGQHAIYSKYGIGHSLLALPPLAAAYFIQKTTGVRCEAALYTLMFIANGALFLGMVAFYLAHFYSARAVWLTVMIIGLATIWWPYTKLDFSEPLVLSIAFLGFLIMRFGHPAVGMAVAAFTLSIRLDSVTILGPMIAWYLLANLSVRSVVRIAVSLIPAIGLVLLANYIRYHSVLDLGYTGERFSNSWLVGLYGILLSSGKSIFLFSPPLLLGLLGWKRFAQRKEIRSDAWLFLTICAAQIVLFAKWWDWSSDDAWGVRFVIPGVLLMCIPMVTILDRKLVILPLVTLGVLVQLLAVTIGGLDYVMLIRAQPFQRQAVFVGGRDRIDFEDVRFDPHYGQIMGNWILFRYLVGFPPSPGRPEDALLVGTRLADAIPMPVWAAAARWDFIWNPRTRLPNIAAPVPVSPPVSPPVQ
jgi:hypothetical protein